MKIKRKIQFTMVVLIMMMCGVVARAMYLQVINRDKLVSYYDTQFYRKSTLYPFRGQILDRNLNPLALNIRKYDISVMPQVIAHEADFRKACAVIDWAPAKCATFFKKSKKRNKFTWMDRDIRLTEKQTKQLKKISGIIIDEKYSRFYPNGESLAQVLGFTNIDNQGISGVENFFDANLKGDPKLVKYLRDAKGRPIKFESILFHGKGEDITLSIDKDLQAMVEKYLEESVSENFALRGGAAVMDPKTGEILAMTNYPSFNPNNYGNYSAETRKNSFVTDPIEPGSVFKLFTIAAGIDAGLIKSNSKYYCEKGSYKIGKYTIKEAAGHKYEWLTVADIFKESSNIGTTKIAFDIGHKVFSSFLEKIKIGQKTGIEISGESKGIFPYFKVEPKKIELSNISFGQGVATTPIQILASYSAIANDGLWIKPTILKVEDQSKVTFQRVLKSATVKELEKMLSSVVESGTGLNAQVKNYRIAGKTSTAQKVGPDGKYDGIIAAFIGYPLDTKKRYVVYVYIDSPKGKIYGNEVAAPVFQKIMSYLLYKNREISSDNQNNLALKAMDKMEGDQLISQLSSLKKLKPEYDLDEIPDLVDLDKSSVMEIADVRGLNVITHGKGIAVRQSIKAGEKMTHVNQVIEVYFQEPTL